jgi:Lipopolysaccharide-assembly
VICVFLAMAMFLSGCGYQVSGRASRLPPGIKTIAVLGFENRTNRYRIEQRMTQAVVREFLSRTRYRIVSTEDSADAVLHGEILSLESAPVVFDTTANPNTNIATARATTMLVSVHIKVWLEDCNSKSVLYHNDDFLFREPYEVSTDVPSFFDEQGPALDRMVRDFASHLVAGIVENF